MRRKARRAKATIRKGRSARKARRSPPRRLARKIAQAAPRRRALTALHEMRAGKSLTKAARRSKTSRVTVRKYAKTAVVRTDSGRYKPRGYDRLTREMRFLTDNGVIALPIQSSASASRIGEYWNAVDRYLKTGRVDRLRVFANKRVKVRGMPYKFVTDTLVLDRLANAGEVRFEDLYPLTT